MDPTTKQGHFSSDAGAVTGTVPVSLMLGMGWFPDQAGGLNRYFRGIFAALDGEERPQKAVVIGPVAQPPPGLIVASDHQTVLPVRLLKYARAAQRAGSGVGVVDAHFALYAALPVLIGRRLRALPLVVHFQGPWASESQAVGQSGMAVRVKRRVEGVVYRRADQVVVLSPAFKRILVETYRVSPWSVTVIPPGVDLTAFHPASPPDREEIRRRLGAAGGAAVVLTVRRLVPRMGIDVLLSAWMRVQQDSVALGEKPLLLVGGTGPERDRLATLAADLGICDTVRFLGALTEGELLAYYQAADLTVVPSIALEGFGLVALESLACGTPVIASSVGGLPEALMGLDGTLLVPPGDPEALAERLSAAISGTRPAPDRFRCRLHAEAFSWPKVAEATRGIYRSAGGEQGSRKLRVVYLDHCAQLSGGEIALDRLLGALRDEVEAHVILAEDGPLVPRLMLQGISTQVVPMADVARGLPRGDISPSSLPLASLGTTASYVIKLAWALRRLQPDVVHTNSLKAAIYGTAAARLARLPVVWHLRDRIAEDYLPSAAIKLLRGLSRFASAIIANSSATLAALNGVSRVVINGVIIHDAYEGASNVTALGSGAGGPLRVGMVGRLAPWKGQHLFLEAFARAFPTGSEQAVLVGAALFGEDAYAGELRAQTMRLGLEGRVQFAGFRENVIDELARFDILVQASVIPEPFGQTVVEGMAAGLAVVAPAAGGPAEVIHDEVDGLLYPPGDAVALAAAMKRLATDQELRIRLGNAALIRSLDFSPEVIAPKVMQVYETVMASRRGRAKVRG